MPKKRGAYPPSVARFVGRFAAREIQPEAQEIISYFCQTILKREIPKLSSREARLPQRRKMEANCRQNNVDHLGRGKVRHARLLQ
jgi:hypothetical protein